MYAVPSTGLDGMAYLLEIHDDNGDVTCTCPGHVNRGICKHVGALMLALDAAAQLELATAAAHDDREAIPDKLEEELEAIGL